MTRNTRRPLQLSQPDAPPKLAPGDMVRCWIKGRRLKWRVLEVRDTLADENETAQVVVASWRGQGCVRFRWVGWRDDWGRWYGRCEPQGDPNNPTGIRFYFVRPGTLVETRA